MAEVSQERRAGIRELVGIGVLTLSALMVLALISYDTGDISILQAPSNDPPLNFIGPVGAWFSFLVLMMFGNGAWLTPLGCILIGLLLLFQPAERIGLRLLWGFVFLLAPVIGRLMRWKFFRPVLQSVMFALAAAVVLDGLLGPQASPVNLAGVLPGNT